MHNNDSIPQELGTLLTERRNERTERIDTLDALALVDVINGEDALVAQAVADERDNIADAIDAITERMQRGGRLIYTGAGTSGRLGFLDASELPPTFNTPPGQVVALIAGGLTAITQAVEGAEDDTRQGAADITALDVTELDSVVGIAASGRTPYVLGCLVEARQRKALTISLTCQRPSVLEQNADIGIAVLVGPEVITGSTRLKAGSAQKMVLNMLSTAVMIRLGKTFGNLMVEVQTTNAKLRARALRIVAQACQISETQAAAILESCSGEVKTAIVAQLAGVSAVEARDRLKTAHGRVRKAVGEVDQ